MLIGILFIAAIGAVLVLITTRSWTHRGLAVLSIAPVLVFGLWLERRSATARDEGSEAQAGESKVGVFGSVEAEQRLATPKAPAAAKGSGADLASVLERAKSVPGLTWPEPGTHYTRESLWNRIDGAAESYRKRGLRGSLFATARLGEADVEVALFDLTSLDNAKAQLTESITGADTTPLPATGDAAVTWKGGGEGVLGPIYVRVVVTGDAPGLDAVAKHLLHALAGTLDSPKPAPVAPAVAEDSPAALLETTPEVVARHGIRSVRVATVGDCRVRTVTFNDAFGAAAWIDVIRPHDAQARPGFAFSATDAAAEARGAVAVWLTGKDALDQLSRQRWDASTLPEQKALGDGLTLSATLDGWSGIAALGRTLVGRSTDGGEVFITAILDAPGVALDALKARFEGATLSADGLLIATDPYLGTMVARVVGARVVGASGWPSVEAAQAEVRKRAEALEAP